MQRLPKGFNVKIDSKTGEADLNQINLFHSDCKFSGQSNFFELFILPSGNLFMSENLLTAILAETGVHGLIFVLLC
jgi:hypothetical protein